MCPHPHDQITKLIKFIIYMLSVAKSCIISLYNVVPIPCAIKIALIIIFHSYMLYFIKTNVFLKTDVVIDYVYPKFLPFTWSKIFTSCLTYFHK